MISHALNSSPIIDLTGYLQIEATFKVILITLLYLMDMPILLVSILVYKKLAKEKAVIQSIHYGIIFMLKQDFIIEKRVTSCKRDKIMKPNILAVGKSHSPSRRIAPVKP